MKDLIFRRYAELSKAWRAGLSNEVFRASVAFLILTVLFFAGYGLLFWDVNKKEAERRAKRRNSRKGGPRNM